MPVAGAPRRPAKGTGGSAGWVRSCAPSRGSAAFTSAASPSKPGASYAGSPAGAGIAGTEGTPGSGTLGSEAPGSGTPGSEAPGSGTLGSEALGSEAPNWAGDGAPGTAEKSSFAQRARVAASGNGPADGAVSVTPPGTSPVGVCVVMVLADLDIIE